MAIFEYDALTENGRLMRGSIEAASRDQALELLGQMKLTVNQIQQAKERILKTAIGRNEFLLFNQQLASITKAGIPLERGLRQLSKDITSGSLRRLVGQIADELESGVSIDKAFEKRQKAFPPLYGKILKAGVETGRLSEMLASLNRHIEISNRTRRIVFEALAYPAVIFVLGAVIITFVLAFIIPQFQQVLREMVGGHLNPITTVFFKLSSHIWQFWAFIGIVIGVFVLLFLLLSTTRGGRKFRESFFISIPVFGHIYRSSVLSKLAESMAMLIAAGNDMPAVLRMAASTSGSEKVEDECEIVAGQIESGAGIMEAAQFCRTIPRLLFYSIQLGSQRNELQDNLYSLAQMYSEQVQMGQVRLQTLLLPVMLIFVGGFIFLSVLAMFLPMVQIITSLSGGTGGK